MTLTPLVDFFPFNMGSGPAFLAFYAAFAFVGLNALRVVRDLVGGFLDGRAFDTASGGLAIGRVPRADDCLAVAYLREGARGVANTLISQAMAEGWLGPPSDADGKFTVSGGQRPQLRASVPFYRDLTKEAKSGQVSADTVQSHAKASAAALEPGLESGLAANGLVRSPEIAWALRLLVWLGGGAILLVGLIRVLRAIELNRPFTLLFWELVVVAVTVLVMSFSGKVRDSQVKQRYLSWLDGATTSLQADVTSGRRREARDVALAVAVGGAAILASPLYAGLTSAFVPEPRPVVSSGGGSSGSSCSSSSCGGGGGCGG